MCCLAGFRRGDFSAAREGYTTALQLQPAAEQVPWLLSNRSLAAARQGDLAGSLADADAAIAAIAASAPEGLRAQILAKAQYRRGAALTGLGRSAEAREAFRVGLAATPLEPGLRAALRSSLEAAPPAHLAQAWADSLQAAECPPAVLLSSRDGGLLKPVRGRSLDQAALEIALTLAFGGELALKATGTTPVAPAPCNAGVLAAAPLLAREARAALLRAWEKGARTPSRGALACFRAAAYIAAGQPPGDGATGELFQQARRDAEAASAFSPKWSLPRALRAWAIEAGMRSGGQDDQHVDMLSSQVIKCCIRRVSGLASTYLMRARSSESKLPSPGHVAC